jgi:hypothetical protein
VIVKLAGRKGWVAITFQDQLERGSIITGRIPAPEEHSQQGQASLQAEPAERSSRSICTLDNTEAAHIAHNRGENTKQEENKEEPRKESELLSLTALALAIVGCKASADAPILGFSRRRSCGRCVFSHCL